MSTEPLSLRQLAEYASMMPRIDRHVLYCHPVVHEVLRGYHEAAQTEEERVLRFAIGITQVQALTSVDIMVREDLPFGYWKVIRERDGEVVCDGTIGLPGP